MTTPITMKVTLGALAALASSCERKSLKMKAIQCHASNIAFIELNHPSFSYAKKLLNEAADKRRTYAGVANCIQAAITEINRVIDAAHAEALEFNAEFDEVAAAEQWDEWANQHDSRKTVEQMIESDHAEALEMNDDFNHAQSVKAMKESAISCDCEVARQHQERVEFWFHCQSVRDALVAAAHTEALEENAAREGTATIKINTVRGDQLHPGMTVRTPHGDLEIADVKQVSDNELRVYWTTGQIGRSLHPHTMVTVIS